MTADPYDTLRELIAIDSPSGFTDEASDFIAATLASQGWSPTRTRKGAVRCRLGERPTLALAAHVDTLGAIVSTVSSNGTLGISPLGGLALNSVEGEYLRVRTLGGEVVTGTLLLDNPSAHANAEHTRAQRSPANMHVRLDALVSCRDDVAALGVEIGDVVCFDPRYQACPSGHIKSRFLDNKAGCFALLELARRLATERQRPAVELFFSTYEEVGHGGAPAPSPSVEELLVIDMGVIGDPCQGRETACSICAKDSAGPYDLAMRKRLLELARRDKIAVVQDVYPFYSSDGSAAWRAGADVRVALIGPGVAASHGTERTHRTAIEATIALTHAYVATHHDPAA